MDITILTYQDAHGQSGKLKGLVTFSDGRTCRVWEDEHHAACLQLAAERVTPVTYEFKTSAKWGRSLTAITRAGAYVAAYDNARVADEQLGDYAKANSYRGRKIAQAVSARDEAQESPSRLAVGRRESNGADSTQFSSAAQK